MDSEYVRLIENDSLSSSDKLKNNRLNGSSNSNEFTNSIDSDESDESDSSDNAISCLNKYIEVYNPFKNEFNDENNTYNIDSIIIFSQNKSKSHQRSQHIKGIQYELFLYLSLISILFMVSALYLKKYYFIVPFIFCTGTVYGVYTFHKEILKWSTIMSLLMNLSLILVIIVKAFIDWNYMMFIISLCLSILYFLILFRQLQYYYYIPPNSDDYLCQFYKYCLHVCG